LPPPDDAPDHLDLYAVLDSLPDGVTLADREGRIFFSNRAADRILGVGPAVGASPDDWSDYYGVFLPDGTTEFPTESATRFCTTAP
jgi:PAS domain-containing protein